MNANPATPAAELKTEHWQTAMDAAYEKFTDTMKYGEFLQTLNPVERVVVLLGNLNGQVNNGGFRQWVDNGYALHGMAVLDSLQIIRTNGFAEHGEWDVLGALKSKIRKLMKFVNLHARPVGFAGDYWVDSGRFDGDDETHHGAEYAESLDSWYYAKAAPALETVMARYLAVNAAKP